MLQTIAVMNKATITHTHIYIYVCVCVCVCIYTMYHGSNTLRVDGGRTGFVPVLSES